MTKEKELLTETEALHKGFKNYDEYLESKYESWNYSDIYNLHIEAEDMADKWEVSCKTIRKQRKVLEAKDKRINELSAMINKVENNYAIYEHNTSIQIKKLEEENFMLDQELRALWGKYDELTGESHNKERYIK